MNETRKKTKIIATLGPVSSTYEEIKGLIEAGANVFRLNTSHGTFEEHIKKIEIIRQLEEDLKIYLPIIVDLQGPKIRVGQLKEPMDLKLDDTVYIQYGKEQTESNIIPVDCNNVLNNVKECDKILFDDGKISLRVMKIAKDKIEARVTNAGILQSRKGMNIPGTTTGVEAISDYDIKCIEFAVKQNVSFIALSFVRTKNDVINAKKHIQNFNGNIPVIAKIEKPQAVDNLDEIIKEADGIMVARGDLGIELSSEKVPIVQKEIINKSNIQRKVVIVATQMLETMIEQPIPTRAEASDVANAIIDGADAIMLSGETSVGKHAKEAVLMMSSIASNVENSDFCLYNEDFPILDTYRLTSQAIVSSAIKLAENVRAKMILAFTHTGYSPRLMSKLRPKIPVVIISDMKDTCRRLNLYWGLNPVNKDWDQELSPELLNEIDKYLLTNTTMQKDDRIIFVGAIPHLITGHTNFARVHRIGAAKINEF